jgi:hypothetical protein
LAAYWGRLADQALKIQLAIIASDASMVPDKDVLFGSRAVTKQIQSPCAGRSFV